MSLKDTSEVDGAQSASCEIDQRRLGWYVEPCEIVLRPASDDDDLRIDRYLAQKFMEPREPGHIGVHQVVVEHDRALQLVRDR